MSRYEGLVQNVDRLDPIFRVVPARNVLGINCASVFRDELTSQVAASQASSAGADLLALERIETQPHEQEEHGQADLVWNSSAPTVRASAFISHVWTASGWGKYFALCYKLNGRLASLAFVLVALLNIAPFFMPLRALRWQAVVDAKSYTVAPAERALRIIIIAPICAYALVLMFGHMLMPVDRLPKLWIDKLCIHQSRTSIKTRGISSLHNFVKNSERFYLLWSETYFTRLWCMCELGTFGATRGVEAIEFLPLWYAPFILGTMVGSGIYMYLAPLVYSYISMPYLLLWLMENVPVKWITPISYLGSILNAIPSLPILFFTFREKIRCSRNMYEQFENFSLRKTCCLLESDRAFVYRMIKRLYTAESDDLQLYTSTPSLRLSNLFENSADDQAVEDTAFQRFDDFVRSDLQRAAKEKVGGKEADIPYVVNLLVHSPAILCLLWDFVTCAGAECNASAKAQYYPDGATYVKSTFYDHLFFILICEPWMCPMMLSGMNFIDKHAPRALVGVLQSLVLILVQMLNNFNQGLIAGGFQLYFTTMDTDMLCATLATNIILTTIFFWPGGVRFPSILSARTVYPQRMTV